MVSVDRRLYVFGGCGGEGRLSDLHAFDTETSTWEELPSSPAICGRGGACFFAIGKMLYVVAGFSGQENGDMHSYSIETREWKQVDVPYLRPRSVCGHTVVDNKIVIIGGEVDPSDKGHAGAGQFAGDIVVIEPPSPSSSAAKCYSIDSVGGDIPLARGWMSCASTGAASLAMCGGLAGDDENPTRLGDTFALDIEF